MNRQLKLITFTALFLGLLGVFFSSLMPNNTYNFGENVAYAQEEEQKEEEQKKKRNQKNQKRRLKTTKVPKIKKVTHQKKVKKKPPKKSNFQNKIPLSIQKHFV